MKKVCVICGYSVGSRTKECPNCGSFDFRIIEEENNSSKRFRRFQ